MSADMDTVLIVDDEPSIVDSLSFLLQQNGYRVVSAASGLQAQSYLSAHGVTERQLANVVTRRWTEAARRGRVEIDSVPDAEAVLASANVAAPLKKLMMSRPIDGAVAVLLASEDIARRVARTPVWFTGLGSSMDRHAFAARKPGTLEACTVAARRAYDNAGWKSVKPSLAEVSASSAVTELMVLESLGLAAPGHGIDLLDDAAVAVNLSGGALPADPIMATGLLRLSEAMRQLSTPGLYGLKAPTSAVVHGAGGVGMQTHCVMTLEV